MSKGSNTTRVASNRYNYMSANDFAKAGEKQKITKEEADAIYDKETGYISPSYNEFIDAFYGGDVQNSKYGKTVKALDSVIKKNRLQSNIMLYRGDEAFNLSRKWGINASTYDSAAINALNSKVGSTYKEDSFLSTSAVRGANLMSDSHFQIEIQVPRGTHAFISKNTKESETILGRGQTYQLIGARKEGKHIVVTYKAI